MSIRGPEHERVRSNTLEISEARIHLMSLVLLFIFIMVPMLEIVVLIQVGGIIGLWLTLAEIVATAALGSVLIRHQGLEILKQAQSIFISNRLPVGEITDGICLLLAGALLLTPGFISDLLGGLFLIRLFRNLIQTIVLTKFRNSNRIRTNNGEPEIVEGNFTVYSNKEDLVTDPEQNIADTTQEDNVSSRWGRK